MRLYQQLCFPFFHIILIWLSFFTRVTTGIRVTHLNSSASNTLFDGQRDSDRLGPVKCYKSVMEEEEILWYLDQCAPVEHWCIKVISRDKSFQIRDCDPGFCDAFGERCGPGEEAHTHSILPGFTLCCCHEEACNSDPVGGAYSITSTLALLFLLCGRSEERRVGKECRN